MVEEQKITIENVDPDQILTEDEKRACKECFDAYDKLGYGTLEAEELQKVLEELGNYIKGWGWGVTFDKKIPLFIKKILFFS